ncbi:hypothetical protein [Rhizobium chutanense]|uniref:Uncharacterized protein n=1 Tax=Rhizobium chutanense TaxID=2035448 RepID=A0A432P3P3_9HYPH|nr:hypothetical protein [Rhizobium chutanense]RUM06779.1 hypothetical protein EFR84_11300 [Rhizobium chutanense]
MGHLYKDRREKAMADAARCLANHIMVEEPVKSFRFHMHYVDKKVTRREQGAYPFLRVLPPVEAAKFTYNSFYAFTLTWTPGHMTIVGDLGELTVVHYQAMPTLEEACNWLLSPDYHYLLSKTKEQRAFQRDETIEDIWRCLTQEVADSQKALAEETAEWEAEKPKWLKREGMTKREFEQALKCWNEDHPKIHYGFRECPRPSHYLNRAIWSEAEEFGWHVPEGFLWLARLWNHLRDVGECFERDPNFMLTDDGLERLKHCFEMWASSRAEDELIGMMYRDVGYDDYSGVYEYRSQAFFQIAAIQHGARMILDRHFAESKVAA